MTVLSRADVLRSAVLPLLLSACALPAAATPAAPAVRAEIEAVLTRLADSGCKFNRNGDWHDAREARTHLLRKLSYLEDKASVKSTDQFIELAATKSSASGKTYQVQCPGEGAVPSSQWLRLQLMTVRGTPGLTAPSR